MTFLALTESPTSKSLADCRRGHLSPIARDSYGAISVVFEVGYFEEDGTGTHQLLIYTADIKALGIRRRVRVDPEGLVWSWGNLDDCGKLPEKVSCASSLERLGILVVLLIPFLLTAV